MSSGVSADSFSVLSAVILLLGAGFDVFTLPPRPNGTMLRVTLRDGRQVTLDGVPHELFPSKAEQGLVDRLVQERAANAGVFDLRSKGDNVRQAVDRYGKLASMIADLPGFGVLSGSHDSTAPKGFLPLSVQWYDLQHVELLREERPSHLSWFAGHTDLSRSAIGIVILLWIGFLAARWIARGFMTGPLPSAASSSENISQFSDEELRGLIESSGGPATLNSPPRFGGM